MKVTLVVFSLLAVCMELRCTESEDILWLAEDYYPFNYDNNGKVDGINVIKIKAIIGHDDLEIEIVPWSRAIAILDSEQPACILFMIKTLERSKKYRFFALEKIQTKGLLVKKNNFKAIKSLGVLLNSHPEFSVALVRGDNAQEALAKAGFEKSNMVLTNNTESLITLLNLDRVSAVAISEQSALEHLSVKNLSDSDYQLIYEFEDTIGGPACNHNVSSNLIAEYQSHFNVRDNLDSDAIH